MALDGQVALVTGGGRGIGRAAALALARAGADVAVSARTGAEIEGVASELRALGRRALAVRSDVASAADSRAMVERVVGELGRIDVLVNNAGGSSERALLVDSDPAMWADTIAVNLVGVYHCTRAVLPHLVRAGRGKIINIGSGTGHAVSTGNAAYSAAKAGVRMLTQVLAQEVWPHGIDVNEVVPGPVITKLTEGVFRTDAPPPFAPSERVKQPEEVAELIVWLAERPAGGPTGQIFSLARRPL
jgi:3-oxoacyl-[acyl-carrier protein] reductase